MPSFSENILIKASPKKVFDVVSDFARYPKLLPEIERADVLEMGPKGAKVSFTANLIKRVDYTLAFKFKHPSEISWKMVEADPVIKTMSGVWYIESVGKDKTCLEFTTTLELNMWLSGPIVTSLMKEKLPKMLKTFKKRAERK